MAKSEIAIRDGWFPRLLRALKLVQVDNDGTTTHVAGSDFVTPQPAHRDYKALDSMSAMAAFPWVRACVDAISSDLTKVGIKAIKGRGKDAEPLDDHPLLDLLDRPSSRVSGVLFRRQLIVDLTLTGDAFVLVVGSPQPQALLRLHPERVRVIPSPDGQPLEYEYTGTGKTARYGFEQVLHIRMPSWSDTTTGLYGSGAIQALNNDLNTDLAASKLASESAKTGLPTGILSPSEEGDRWSKMQITQLREGFQKQLNSKSGTVILGAGVEYQQLSQTLRDMEYKETRLMAREAVLAAMGVPPSRVGLPNANYATAMAQSRLYWEGLSGKAALIDSELTRLARLFPDSEGVRIYHDFSEVDALQESRTERVNRVQSWWLMGVDLAEAAALEGFDSLQASEVDAEIEAVDENEAIDADTESLASLIIADDETAVKAVGDTDPTNFPQDGDDETVSLRNSGFDVFDVDFAEMIKTDYPSIWREGGNIKGNEQYRKLKPIAEGGGAVDGRAEEGAVRLRESWAARHFEDYRLAGVVAQIKWLVVGSKGEAYMKGLIKEEIDKIESKTAKKWLVVNDEKTVERDYDTPEGREVVWRSFIERIHGPAERKLAITMRRYLKGQSSRISKRLKAEIGAKGVTKALDDAALDRILDEMKEKSVIQSMFKPLYRDALRKAFDDASKSIKVSQTLNPREVEQAALQRVREMAESILNTVRDDVRETIDKGLREGQTLAEMQQNISTHKDFTPSRAMRIARTETTRLSNFAANEAYTKAESVGLRVQKMWLSARDGKVRDSHMELDGTWVESAADFSHDGASASGPGEFGTGALDINCRCTTVGRVIS